jgi:transposase
LIEDLPAEAVMADTAYDSDHIRRAVADKGALAVIPNNPSRAQKHPLDAHLYAQRHLVECCISRLKQFRRVATRFERAAAGSKPRHHGRAGFQARTEGRHRRRPQADQRREGAGRGAGGAPQTVFAFMCEYDSRG